MAVRYGFLACVALYMSVSCAGNYTPKPTGYLRIETPNVQYVSYDDPTLRYTFALSQWASVETPPSDSIVEPLNIDYPAFNAKIYCSYRPLARHSIDDCTAECRALAERAAEKADAITEKYYEDRANRVYGVLFAVEGASPSPVQFILTDSAAHFFRGALYYRHVSNVDSIAPVTDFITNDIMTLIQTFRWKR